MFLINKQLVHVGSGTRGTHVMVENDKREEMKANKRKALLKFQLSAIEIYCNLYQREIERKNEKNAAESDQLAIITYAAPSCGGVSIDIRVNSQDPL